MILISPSLLSADFTRLEEEIQNVESAGADWLHLDVMDGHFVDNITFGPDIVESIRDITELVLDVHLMITHPLQYAKRFVDAGADIVTFHIECEDSIDETIEAIKEAGAEVGLSLKPGTPFSEVEPYIEKIDLVLIMTVEPGFGGQKFMGDMAPKIAEVYAAMGPEKYIAVDGGVGPSNARIVAQAGANILVAGASIFRSGERAETISFIRKEAELMHPANATQAGKEETCEESDEPVQESEEPASPADN